MEHSEARGSEGHAEPPPRTVAEVVAIEALQVTEPGSRRAVVRWSDGEVGEAARWYDDEILVCEGDLLGKSEAEVRALLFRRDREYLQDDYG